MSQFGELLSGLAREESGQDLVEYALVIALIALAAAATMKTLAQTIVTALTLIGTKVTNAV